jgi:hypothetical protein
VISLSAFTVVVERFSFLDLSAEEEKGIVQYLNHVSDTSLKSSSPRLHPGIKKSRRCVTPSEIRKKLMCVLFLPSS